MEVFDGRCGGAGGRFEGRKVRVDVGRQFIILYLY